MIVVSEHAIDQHFKRFGGIVAVYANDVVVTVYKYNAENWKNWYNA